MNEETLQQPEIQQEGTVTANSGTTIPGTNVWYEVNMPAANETTEFTWDIQERIRQASTRFDEYASPTPYIPTTNTTEKKTKSREVPVDWDEVDLRTKAIEATCKAFGTRQADLQEFSDLLEQFYIYIKTGKKLHI